VLQKRIIPMFHYALNPQGILLLGGSETIGTFSDLFELTDKRRFDEAVAVLKKNFPRLHQSMASLWGTAQGESFLDGLIVDDRGGRQGFPADTMRALLVLQRIHFLKFGTFKKVDPWDVVKFGK